MNNKKIVVTGGSGKAGRACVDHLLERGYHVLVVDRVVPAQRKCASIVADLTDYGQAIDALSASDQPGTSVFGVVHLSAVPAARLQPNAATFRNNTLSDYNVFEACRRLGIKNIVWASSETVLGLPFDVPPPYVPLDEEYAPRPESAYSLSKLVSETMAEQFCRWDPEMKIFGLRLSNVMALEDYAAFEKFQDDAKHRKWNLWSYIDARDAAQAMRLCLESPLKGAEVFVIANNDTVMRRPNDELLKDVFPTVAKTRDVGTHDSLMSIEKARKMLGFEPKFSWRNQVNQ